jgi:hypothetical protein
MREVIPQMLQTGREGPWLAEDYAALLADVGSHNAAARLIGAADAWREQRGDPLDCEAEADYRAAVAKARKALSPESSNREYQKGHTMTLKDTLVGAHSTTAQPPDKAAGGAPAPNH